MASQREVAQHLDMSERNARDVLKALGIDWANSSLDEIRVTYIRDLRSTAAGRGGENQVKLAEQRTRESRLKGDLIELQLAEKSGELVAVGEVEPGVISMVVAARTELLTMADKLRHAIQIEHGIEVSADMINGHIFAALEHLATGGDDTPGDDGTGEGDVGAAA